MGKPIILLFFCLSLDMFGQDEDVKKNIRIEAGLIYHWNNLNIDSYQDRFGPGTTSAGSLTGIDLRVTLPTKTDFIDLAFGTIVEKCRDEYLTGSMDYTMNGGGVYAGVSPKIGGKHFGMTGLFAVGLLSYKEYFYYYSTIPDPDVDISLKKSSFVGAISSIGVYARLGPVGLHPQVQVTFSGGSNASFLFYGVVVPLTIDF
jgi:hypothetical protein